MEDDEPILLKEYLNGLKEIVKSGKDIENKQLPQKMIGLIEGFIDRQSPIGTTQVVIMSKIQKLTKTVEEQTKGTGFFAHDPTISTPMNNMIDSIQDLVRNTLDSERNFHWLVDKLEDYVVKVVESNKVLQKQLEVKESKKRITPSPEDIETTKADQILEAIMEQAKTHDDFIANDIISSEFQKPQVSHGLTKLEKEKKIRKTDRKSGKSTIWELEKAI